ncbi:DUF1484 domain-containing protein [Cupriavidus sp. WGtm5]|uniref:Uncharacterized protein n=1 Tax=Cupriavidus taiwanensis TaxID=164546 RepID=A0A375CXX9_9BURK|nr:MULTISPECIES: DUF1484 family protein [Cupriavidus]MCO4892039.1 DUF1484 domain-containing protein [Cupriavidus sp. WGtm5]ULX55284.1 hypothetical protein A9P79_25965 [Cupriavidus taiwanensis]SOY83842.1 hypothetical protein CBM2599_A180081 [Cupriavidus taiwanensis]SOY86830.1 hypothetical protein CBM2600_A160082 [Cupriavidus taiwanensis]SPD65969.1 conserved protein of unknown function [Cupriavidus taiwanensis]
MSEIDLSTARYSLLAVAAGIDGVLALLEQQSEWWEGGFAAFCLLGLVKAQLERVLEDDLPAS